MEFSIGGLTFTFGNLYDLTTVDGKTFRATFVGVERSNYDGKFFLFFISTETGGKTGYPVSYIADANPVEY